MMNRLIPLLIVGLNGIVYGQNNGGAAKLSELPKNVMRQFFNNSIASQTTYKNTAKDVRNQQFEFMTCLAKTYDFDFSMDSNFSSEKAIEKYYSWKSDSEKKSETDPIKAMDFLYQFQNKSSGDKREFAEQHPKCYSTR